MKRSVFVRGLGAALILAAAALTAPALARPSSATTGAISFHGGSAAFIVGARWGSGTLRYRGHRYPLQVGGLSVGAVGATSYNFSGTVYRLRRLSDIEGAYAALDASATAGMGRGVLNLKNGDGVEIRATSTSAGLNASLAPSGLTIKLKR
jgi:hypothetical protein